MEKKELDPELERLIDSVKLKEPPQELMRDYLSGVNAKIDQSAKWFHLGLPQLTVLCAIGLVSAGLMYFLIPHTKLVIQVPKTVKTVEVAPARSPEPKVQQNTSSKPLSIEEEMAVLRAFAEERSEDVVELLGDDEVFEELGQLDETELSTPSATQTQI